MQNKFAAPIHKLSVFPVLSKVCSLKHQDLAEAAKQLQEEISDLQTP